MGKRKWEPSLESNRINVFISSSINDLRNYRKEVRDSIWRCDMFPLAMEQDEALPVDAIEYSLGLVDRADVYLGIFAYRYGTSPLGYDISITEMEYHRAVSRNIPMLIFLVDESAKGSFIDEHADENQASKAKLNRLKQELSSRYVVSFFTSPLDLGYKVFESLYKVKKSIPSIKSVKQPQQKESTGAIVPLKPLPYVIHPYILTRQFFGRHDELSYLDQWAHSASSMLIIQAIGGMGKSALTWEWFRNRASSSLANLAGSMWWSFYEGDATVSNFIHQALAYTVHLPPDEIGDPITIDHEQLLIQELLKNPYLIVLDGLERILAAYHRADAAQISDAKSEEISLAEGLNARRCTDPNHGAFLRKLINVSQSKILISTRLMPLDLQDRHTNRLMPGIQLLSIRGLRPNDAVSLVKSLGVKGDEDLIKIFLGQFGYHSLLIGVIAGKILNYPPAPGDFDYWYKDEGKGLRLSELDLSMRRTHILKYAFDALKPELHRVLSQIAAFRYPVEYSALETLNPYMPVYHQPNLPNRPLDDWTDYDLEKLSVVLQHLQNLSRELALDRPNKKGVKIHSLILALNGYLEQLNSRYPDDYHGHGFGHGHYSPTSNVVRGYIEKMLEEVQNFRVMKDQGNDLKYRENIEKFTHKWLNHIQPNYDKMITFKKTVDQITSAARSDFEKRVREARGQFHVGLSDLENRGLLQWDRNLNKYDLHPVVRAYAFEQLNESERKEAFIRGFGCHIDCCVTMCNEKSLNPALTWLPDFSAMYHYTTFGMASGFVITLNLSQLRI